MNYQMKKNLMLFQTPPSLLKYKLRVKSYARFNEALSSGAQTTTQLTGSSSNKGPLVP